jgi:hypothetical protein
MRYQVGKAFHCEHPQQPTQVVTGRARHRMYPALFIPVEVPAVHTASDLQVSIDRLNRLASLGRRTVLLAESIGQATMRNAHIRFVCIHAKVIKVDE